ncbi:outer membrane beta-barrel family protein [Pedobacter rhodius]|uniref:Outer membrane beta-barrel family protein n=1 Tax=Pedobacter rhodius TaxID=3004098 RepID=A0ABT4KYI7_9SPHI|nr:outer membrane beta-barrel family protein [Pedobacter sp. SJ11]MCZ4224000.1 outer membrane beta-barrel family protein [Pedobacter sp. SJ11]
MSRSQEQYKISGKVNSPDKKGVPYATVTLFKDALEFKVTACDSSGNFVFAFNDDVVSQKLYLQAKNFSSVSEKYEIKNNNFIQLFLNPATTDLKTVEIKSAKPVFIRKADRFIFEPTPELAKGNSAIEIMRYTPLLKLDERSETISIINKPGTIIYINNRKSQMPTELLIQTLKSIPASDIKSIEIITNPGSEFDANIAGGIININLKRQINQGWLGNLTLQSVQSAYNTTMLNGGVTWSKQKFALQFIPFFNRSFNYSTRVNEIKYNSGALENLNSTNFRRYLVTGGGVNLDYDIDSANFLGIKLWRTGVSGKSRFNGNTNFNHPLTDSTEISAYDGNDKYTYSFGNINYRWQLNKLKDSYLDINLDYNHFFQRKEYSGEFTTTGNNSAGRPTLYFNILPQKFTNYSQKVEFSRRITLKSNLVSGVQFSSTNVGSDLSYNNVTAAGNLVESPLSNSFLYNEHYFSAFSVLKSQISKKWNANVGLRLEYTNYSTENIRDNILRDSSYFNLFPSFSVSFSPSFKHQLAVSFSRNISRPNIELLFPGRTYNNSTFFTENNPFLMPALVYKSEFSYVYNSQYAFQLSYYSTKNAYSSFIVSGVEANQNILRRTYVNYGSVNEFNLVINSSKNFFKNFWSVYFTPYLNYRYYAGKVGSTVVSDRNLNLNLILDNYIFLSRKKNWTAFLTYTFNGPKKDISGERINAGNSLDFQLKKVIGKFSLNFIATDLFNGNSIAEVNQFADLLITRNYSRTNSYNRSVMLRVRYNFGNTKLRVNKGRGTANDDIRGRAN